MDKERENRFFWCPPEIRKEVRSRFSIQFWESLKNRVISPEDKV